MTRPHFLAHDLPSGLEALADLALDLRWTWSHAGDAFWKSVDAATWEETRNPWVVLQNLTEDALRRLAADRAFRSELERLLAERACYLEETDWFARTHGGSALRQAAYFSMEFALSEALPIYAGGLGILAGDFLKASSDLGLPMVGVGLLYQEGYFRQTLDASGRQEEIYTHNDATSLPIQPLRSAGGGWLRVSVEFPGRTVHLRCWEARVGRVTLYLLDANDPLNSPADRGITARLYAGGVELRLEQELVLGIGGWRMLEAMGKAPEICHLNEGHAAFVVLERARAFRKVHDLPFRDALWATRAGNVFTTHTPVAAGFDSFPPALIEKYFPPFGRFLGELGISTRDLLALGRMDPGNPDEAFNMAYLALRGSIAANGVSELHGRVSRRLFSGLYPRWPEWEVPVTHVTNGVHVPSWDSVWADDFWTKACGKARWRGESTLAAEALAKLPDRDLWKFHALERADLVRYARTRLARQLGERGADPATVARVSEVLDPDILTLGFARRFSEYKRPSLLLREPERLEALLTSRDRPIQLILAGKAHPRDEVGKSLVQAWALFARRPSVRHRVVFIEDYDMALAQELVQGVDVWINAPRRPWEACGTSGMKVLVNGGLNLSALDGWWAEAWSPEVGWAFGGPDASGNAGNDESDARRLFEILEGDVIPEFYRRDPDGLPRAWVARMRASMVGLTERFGARRMVREYVESLYLPSLESFRRRTAGGGAVARELSAWERTIGKHWPRVRFGAVHAESFAEGIEFQVEVFLQDLNPELVAVELWANPFEDFPANRVTLERGEAMPGPASGHIYRGRAPGSRPPEHYTPRVVPRHPEARIPGEVAAIVWQR